MYVYLYHNSFNFSRHVLLLLVLFYVSFDGYLKNNIIDTDFKNLKRKYVHCIYTWYTNPI